MHCSGIRQDGGTFGDQMSAALAYDECMVQRLVRLSYVLVPTWMYSWC